LALAGAGADDEVIDVGRKLANVQQNDVFTLLVFNGVDDAVCEIENFQNILLNE
jgi:hypothetical protein